MAWTVKFVPFDIIIEPCVTERCCLNIAWQYFDISNILINFATELTVMNMKNQNEIVGANLKRMREYLGYTQDVVARALGIGRSAYSNYESGDREMPYDLVEKASDFFGCDAYLLFEEDVQAQNEMLATTFRIDGLSESDCEEIIRFKDLVKTSLKLDRIANE